MAIAEAYNRFNRGFERLSERYVCLTARLVRRPKRMMPTYPRLNAAPGAVLLATPTGFHLPP